MTERLAIGTRVLVSPGERAGVIESIDEYAFPMARDGVCFRYVVRMDAPCASRTGRLSVDPSVVTREPPRGGN